MMGQPEDPTIKKSKNPKVDIPSLGIPVPVDEQVLRNMQRKDVLSNDELYETELGVNEKNIPVTNEKFENKVKIEDIPIVPSVKEILEKPIPEKKEDIPMKTSFVQDENHPIPTKKVVDTPPTTENKPMVKDISEDIENNVGEEEFEKPKIKKLFERKKDLSVDDLDEDGDSKEYISRHDIIYSERKELEKYSPGLVIYEENDDEEENESSTIKNIIAILFLIIIGFCICWGVYHFVSVEEKVPVIKYSLTDADREILTEEYFFISNIESYLTTINEIVDDEKQLVDSYVSGLIDKDEALQRAKTTLLSKENLYELYIKIKPTENEVIETKKLSDSIFNNTISYSKSLISDIETSSSKSRMVANFNVHVEDNNSNIYMYNQYVMSVFKKRGITITYDGVKFAMDTKWLDNN